MTNKEKLKKAIKDYQGKYFKGTEMYKKDTYVYIKKIIEEGDATCSYFHTYADTIYKCPNKIVFAQNVKWNFGKYHIDKYGYKKINSLLFNEVLNYYKFEKDKNNREFIKKEKPID